MTNIEFKNFTHLPPSVNFWSLVDQCFRSKNKCDPPETCEISSDKSDENCKSPTLKSRNLDLSITPACLSRAVSGFPLRDSLMTQQNGELGRTNSGRSNSDWTDDLPPARVAKF